MYHCMQCHSIFKQENAKFCPMCGSQNIVPSKDFKKIKLEESEKEFIEVCDKLNELYSQQVSMLRERHTKLLEFLRTQHLQGNLSKEKWESLKGRFKYSRGFRIK